MKSLTAFNHPPPLDGDKNYDSTGALIERASNDTKNGHSSLKSHDNRGMGRSSGAGGEVTRRSRDTAGGRRYT